MREEVAQKVNLYNTINEMALKNEIVIFGSTFAANFPVYELQQNYVMSNAIYNRSIQNLTVKEALSVVSSCVTDIKPGKVFLSFGENEDILTEFIENYKKLIFKIKEKCHAVQIYLLSINDRFENKKDFNAKIKELAERSGVKYLKIDYCDKDDICEYKKIFKRLSCFFRSGNLSFSEAFLLASK